MYAFDDTPHEHTWRFVGCTAIIFDQEDITWWECSFFAEDYEGTMMFGWNGVNPTYQPLLF